MLCHALSCPVIKRPDLLLEAAWVQNEHCFRNSETDRVVVEHGALPTSVQPLQSLSDDVREQVLVVHSSCA